MTAYEKHFETTRHLTHLVRFTTYGQREWSREEPAESGAEVHDRYGDAIYSIHSSGGTVIYYVMEEPHDRQ